MPPFSLQSAIPPAASNHSAFITHIGKYLPGEPIANDEMEAYLGRVGDRPSRVKNRILKSNGIQQRYYADRKSTRLNSSHLVISYAVFCLKKKKNININPNKYTSFSHPFLIPHTTNT